MTHTIKSQCRKLGPKVYTEGAQTYRITANVRHDDSCGNGFNSFAITGEIERKVNGVWRDDSFGCMHDEIAQHFPELAPLIKWHLCGTGSPMHYVANTLYWLGYSGWCDGKAGSPPNIEHARSTAIWPDMPESMIAPQGFDSLLNSEKDVLRKVVTDALNDRMQGLMPDFRAAVEGFGFVF
ncbi:hypothetical protein EBT31_01080 [bacterium]|nr:hypothetical protein [bacterium]